MGMICKSAFHHHNYHLEKFLIEDGFLQLENVFGEIQNQIQKSWKLIHLQQVFETTYHGV